MINRGRDLPGPGPVAQRDTTVAIQELSPLDASQLGLIRHLESTTPASVQEYMQPERRLAERYPLQVVAMATPLDEQFRPTGAPFPVLTRDISPSGIGLVHSRPLDMKYIQLDLTGPNGHELHMTVEVLRCNRFLCGQESSAHSALDDQCTYYESGGRFVADPRR